MSTLTENTVEIVAGEVEVEINPTYVVVRGTGTVNAGDGSLRIEGDIDVHVRESAEVRLISISPDEGTVRVFVHTNTEKSAVFVHAGGGADVTLHTDLLFTRGIALWAQDEGTVVTASGKFPEVREVIAGASFSYDYDAA